MFRAITYTTIVAFLVTAGVGLPTFAEGKGKGKGKGGHYTGGEGSSHKGGSYVPPKGKRYSR